MGIDEYFGTIILILEGLSFVAIFLIFLYMIYGEKEEGKSSTRVMLPMKIINFFLHFSAQLTIAS